MTTVERKRLEKKWNSVSMNDPVPHVRLRGYRIVKRYKPLHTVSPVDGGLKCLSCNYPIEYLTSTKGKVIIGMGSKTEVRSIIRGGKLVAVETVLGFPIMKTGRACTTCKGKLKVLLHDEGLE